MKIVRLSKEQSEKLDKFIQRKKAFHKAIREHGPASDQAKAARERL